MNVREFWKSAMIGKMSISAGVIIIASIAGAHAKETKNKNKLKITNEVSWKQKDDPKNLGIKGDQGACFLTRVTGRFYGDGEEVRVYIDGADGEWKISGKSGQDAVSASARCIITK